MNSLESCFGIDSAGEECSADRTHIPTAKLRWLRNSDSKLSQRSVQKWARFKYRTVSRKPGQVDEGFGIDVLRERLRCPVHQGGPTCGAIHPADQQIKKRIL
jgi:hypothetical protein